MTTKPIYKSTAGQQAIIAFYEDVLARWPVPYEGLTLSTRHGSTFVIVCGDPAASPLLLLHGSGTNSAMWAGEVAALAAHHRVYAIDVLGEPGKSAPNRLPLTGAAHVDWLADLLTALQLDQVTLVGYSHGGWLALKFATAQPTRIDRLILITPGGVVPTRLSWLLLVIPLAMLGRWGLNRINRIVFGKAPIPPEVAEFSALLFKHFRPHTEAQPRFPDAALQQLTMPVLLLIGEQDSAFAARKMVARLQRLLPQLQAVIIPEGSHVLYNTADYILPFLKA